MFDEFSTGTVNKVDNIVREGTVSEVYPARHSARVTFEDRAGMVSAEIPVLTTFASANKSYGLPDVGERVVCLCTSNDHVSGGGYVIGSLYSGAGRPAVNDQDVAQVRFADGSTVTYNRRENSLVINVKGRLEINVDGRIDIKAGENIHMNADGDIVERGSTIRLN